MESLYVVKTAAAEDPITLNEAKSWLRVDSSADDALIASLIKAATIQGEKYCNRLFVTRSIEAKFSAVTGYNPLPFVDIARAPLASLTSVEYVLASVLTAVPATDYELQDTNGFPRIVFNPLPDADDVAYPLVINFDAGYGAALLVPDDIKTAIKEHVSFLYENRGDVQAVGKEAMPITTEMIYRTGYRIIATF